MEPACSHWLIRYSYIYMRCMSYQLRRCEAESWRIRNRLSIYNLPIVFWLLTSFWFLESFCQASPSFFSISPKSKDESNYKHNIKLVYQKYHSIILGTVKKKWNGPNFLKTGITQLYCSGTESFEILSFLERKSFAVIHKHKVSCWTSSWW